MDTNIKVPELVIQRFAQIPTLDFGKIRSGDSKSQLIDIVNPSNEGQELRLSPLPINGKLSLKILDPNHDSQKSPVTIQCSLVTPYVKNAQNADDSRQLPMQIKVGAMSRCRVEVTWRPLCQQTLKENLMFLWGRIGLHIEVKGWATQRRHTINQNKGGQPQKKTKTILNTENLQLHAMNTSSALPPPTQNFPSDEQQVEQENKVLLIQGLSPIQSASPTRLPLTPVQQSCSKQPDIIDMMQIDNNNNNNNEEDIFGTPIQHQKHKSDSENICSNNDDDLQKQDSFFTPQSDCFESVPSLKFRSDQFPVQISTRKKQVKTSSSMSSFGVKNKLMTSSSRLSLPTSRSNVTGKSKMKSRDEQKRDYSYCQKDQVWEKQETALVQWLNLKLATIERDDNQSKFVDERTQAKVRGMLMRIILKDEQVRNVMTKVEERIDRKTIVLNAGNNYLCDVLKKQRALAAVLCFNHFWVKVVLELIAKNQKTTLIEGASWCVKDSEEIIRIFLFNEHPDVYSAEFDFETPAFKRILQMLLILDISFPQITQKVSSLPLLFKKDAPLKTTESVFAQILDGSVFGTGDIVRDFGRIGYRLLQKQQMLFEFDFDIKNLAVDLRDGIRLARLAEVLTQNKQILTEIKFPPISKTTKRWNVAHALIALQSGGVQLSGRVDADDIVEGSREKTLLLLWEIQQTCLVEHQLDIQLVQDEIKILRKSLLQRGVVVSAQSVVQLCAGMECTKDALLLLEWALLLAQYFKLPTQSIPLAFADGSLLCYMVKKYIPRHHVTNVYEVRLDGMQEFGDWVDFYVHFDSLPLHTQQQMRLGVQRNYDMIQQVGWMLGDVPCLLSVDDSFTPPGPDPKIILMFLSLFAARLLHASVEERAAYKIQKSWRNSQQRKQLGEFGVTTIQQWKAAAKVISRCVRCWLARRRMISALIQRQQISKQVEKVQAVWRGRKCVMQYKQYRQQVVLCQNVARKYLARRKLQQLRSEREAVVLQQKLQMIRSNLAIITIQQQFRSYRYQNKVLYIQAQVRMKQQRDNYKKTCENIKLIQQFWRDRRIKQQYQYFRSFIIKLQSIVRGFLVRKQLLRHQNAATKIQSYFKMQHCVKQFQMTKQAVRKIEQFWRDRRIKQQYQHFRDFVIKLQAIVRGFLVRKQLLRYQGAATKIQNQFKMWLCVKQFQNRKQAVRKIEQYYRMYKMQVQFQQLYNACIVVQKNYRRYSCRKRYLNTILAVQRIQQSWQGVQEVKKQNLDLAATIIQKCYKCYICQKQYQERKQKIIRVQAMRRGIVVRRQICDLRKAVVAVEKQWKIRQEKLEVCRQTNMMKLQRRQEILTSAATKIQRSWRWFGFQRSFSHDENNYQSLVQCWNGDQKKNKLSEILVRQYLKGKVGKLVLSFIEFGSEVQQQKDCSARIIQKAYLDYRYKEKCRRRLKILGILKRQVQVIECRRNFKRVRRCCIVIQQYWRKYLSMRKEKAVARIQSAFRGFQVRKQMGFKKRRVHQRLLLATKEVQKNPKKQIGIRCKEALEKLLAAKSHVHIAEGCELIKSSTAYSKMCCELIAKNGGVCALLKFIRSCNRSGPHVRIVSSALDILDNICRFNHLLPFIFNGECFLECLTERLQLYRDMEDIFLKVVEILRRVLSLEEHMQQVAKHSSILKQWHGIQGLLERKRDSDALYLSRLEGKKGSDVCAQQATQRLVNVKRQLEAFCPLIDSVDQALLRQKQLESEENQKENTNSLNRINHQVEQSPMTSKISGCRDWQPKNVKVQEAMKNYNKRKGKTHYSFY